MRYETNQKVVVHMPMNLDRQVMHASELRKFNHKVAKITAITGDVCRLDIDDGKYMWPTKILAPIVPYDGLPDKHDEEFTALFSVKPNGRYYEVYYEEEFVSNADSEAEAECDIANYVADIRKKGLIKWQEQLLWRKKNLWAFM